MKFSTLCTVSAALVSLLGAGAAHAVDTVDLNARAYNPIDQGTYTGFQTLQLAAGTYDISVIAGTYSGWTYKSGSNIREAFDLSLDGGKTFVSYDVGSKFTSYVTSTDALAAFATGPYTQFGGATDKPITATGLAKLQFTTDGSGVMFGLPDNNFSDNGGGVSLSFAAAVPEPQTYALMLGGLGALGVMSRRRKSQG